MNKEEIYKLYWEEEYSLQGVANQIGITHGSTIHKFMKRVGMNRRTHTVAMNTERTKNLIRANKNDTVGVNNGMFGRKHSKETKEKISDSHADVSGERNPMWKKHHTEATKQKIKRDWHKNHV